MLKQAEYEKRFYCNCPKCLELPTRYLDDGKLQWALCQPCGIRWCIGANVIRDCKPDKTEELSGIQQVIAS